MMSPSGEKNDCKVSQMIVGPIGVFGATDISLPIMGEERDRTPLGNPK